MTRIGPCVLSGVRKMAHYLVPLDAKIRIVVEIRRTY